MKLQQRAPFLDWLSANLPLYAMPGSQLAADQDMQRAMAVSLGLPLWNAMPLPRRGFRPEPVPEPGRNEPCPCRSGRKFKHCCARAPALGPFTTDLLWPFVLGALSGPARDAALRSGHLPREAVLHCAADEVETGHPDSAIELLEPMFAEPFQHEDDIAGHALDLLCNAYDARGNARRRKRALLDRVAAGASRSPLRSAAHQRLACILMDRGEVKVAWAAFRKAQQDDPGNPVLGMLEVQLLMGEGRNDEARQRAGFFLRQLRRAGGDLEPRILEFYERVAADPTRAMSDVAFDMTQGVGRRLAEWLDEVRSRPLPVYTVSSDGDDSSQNGAEALAARLRQMGVAEAEIKRTVDELQRQMADLERPAPDSSPDEEAPPPPQERPMLALVAPERIAAIEIRWHCVFPLGKPFSVHPLPWGEENPWQPASESRWMKLLESHPDAYDSIDVLDDLATATMLHPQRDQPAVVDRLGRPLLERAVAILERAILDARPTVPQAVLPWVLATNRPALRALYRLHELEVHARLDVKATRLAERLLALNPDDNHGLRCWLSGAYLKSGDAEACVRLVEAYPDDPSPELRFNLALALYRLGRAQGATRAFQAAHRASPRVTRFVIQKRISKPALSEHGISLDGDDRGWFYREDMRSTWAATPGALDWAEKLARNRSG